jgi:hypothetical protein
MIWTAFKYKWSAVKQIDLAEGVINEVLLCAAVLFCIRTPCNQAQVPLCPKGIEREMYFIILKSFFRSQKHLIAQNSAILKAD